MKFILKLCSQALSLIFLHQQTNENEQHLFSKAFSEKILTLSIKKTNNLYLDENVKNSKSIKETIKAVFNTKFVLGGCRCSVH